MDNAAAQDISKIHHKRKLLKGQWQLVKTVNSGIPHAVAKNDYDAVITFRAFHKYSEEVKYEGYHWIIKGKWKAYRKTDALELTKREYLSGSLGDHPQDISFHLYLLDKKNWGGSTVAKGNDVKMEYNRIPKGLK